MTVATVALLHTADSNVALFDQAADRLGVADRLRLVHRVRPDLLAAVEAAGGLTPELAHHTAHLLAGLAGEARGVILTCSSLGPAVEGLSPGPVPVIRADAALAAAACARPGRVSVLFAAPTSRAVTDRLFTQAAVRTGAVIDLRYVEDAWNAFQAGDNRTYAALIQQEMRRARAEGADRIALAQTSMTVAIQAWSHGAPVLTVPVAALQYLAGDLV